MCGIFGYFGKDENTVDFQHVKKMGDTIDYRGPDGQGIFNSGGVALGNQRLAILDLEHGQQPFISDDGKIVVVQNGEIFNHVEIASELQNTPFKCKTHCDTEVILRLYERDGISFISKLNGMFAIAIYDGNKDELYLIRDRVGEKPLYYYKDESMVAFGSEIKSILALGVKKIVNYSAIDTFLTFNYVPSPMTMFENIFHVQPGKYLSIRRNNVSENTWWDLSSISVCNKSESDWISLFNKTLDEAVRIRLRSDVPFGAFLSGGVDSSTVVGIMSQHMTQPVKTFSIGFHDERFDESVFAQSAATRFETEHVMEKVESNLLSLWPKVTYHCDQPHGDVSFMPTLRVAQLAAEQVKMVLTGDGADELFAGYDKYKTFFTEEIDALDEHSFRERYIKNISLFDKNTKLNLYSEGLIERVDLNLSSKLMSAIFEQASGFDRINQALYIDTTLLLSGNNLVKPDRMGMAVSIENRAPFLDYNMIELAFSMPGDLKLRNGETKYIYKLAVKNLIGDELTYRKKQMFTVPISDWLKNELKPLVVDLLFSEKATSRSLFNVDVVQKIYFDHCEGVSNYTREIRALMALEIWFRTFID